MADSISHWVRGWRRAVGLIMAACVCVCVCVSVSVKKEFHNCPRGKNETGTVRSASPTPDCSTPPSTR
jgi:hypothetical protein